MATAMTFETNVYPIRSKNPVSAEALDTDLLLMKDYLQMCVRKEDWHGVMDASADIREILAKLSVLRAP